VSAAKKNPKRRNRLGSGGARWSLVRITVNPQDRKIRTVTVVGGLSDGWPRTSQLGKAFGAEGWMLLLGPLRGRLSAERSSFKDANPRTAPHNRSGQKKRPRIGGLSIDVLIRKSSRPPFTPEPQKRDGQILVANRIAGEAVVRIVPSNSFDRCNCAA
jgi:hypothetical protein